MASLLDPYEDLNIDLDDTVEGILSTRRKKDKRSEYLLESRLNPYSIWSAAKPKMADATEQSYRDLGARNPIISKDAIASSTPLWSALEWFPGTGAGTKVAGMVGSVATGALKSKAVMKLIGEAKKLGMIKQRDITDYVDSALRKIGYKTGQNRKTTAKITGKYDKETDQWVPYKGISVESVLQQIDAQDLGVDIVKRKLKEDTLKKLGVKLPDPNNPRYRENLRYSYRYHTDDEYRFKVLSLNLQRKVRNKAARDEILKKSGTQNLPENMQIQIAKDRVRSTISNIKNRDLARGGGYHLTDAQEKNLRKQLYEVKLREVKEGTPIAHVMTVDHYYPSTGYNIYPHQGGERVGSGLTTWENITDRNGKVRLISLTENSRKSSIVPSKFQTSYLGGTPKRWRKMPTIMNLR